MIIIFDDDDDYEDDVNVKEFIDNWQLYENINLYIN